MANDYISEITLPDNTTYDLYDKLIRIYDTSVSATTNMLTLLTDGTPVSLFTIGLGDGTTAISTPYKLFYVHSSTPTIPTSLLLTGDDGDIPRLQINSDKLTSYNNITIQNLSMGLESLNNNIESKINIEDKDGNSYANITAYATTAGNTSLQLKAGNRYNSLNFEKGITIQLSNSTTCTYIVDDSDNFRTAIDAAATNHDHGDMYMSAAGGKLQGSLHFHIADHEKGNSVTAIETLVSDGIMFDDADGISESNDRLGSINCQVTTAQEVKTLLFAYKNATGTSNGYFGAGYDLTDDIARTYTNCKVYGAVWNDYAEYRIGNIIDGGYCVTETKDGIMEKTTERLMPGCKITSDTFGFAIGETEIAKTPIAVCGRVLVYPYRNIEEYQLGDALCSAPGGTVDIMTREEIREYPERIIGTVSEIPKYGMWYAGDQQNQTAVPVNGRIWIYVK